MKRKFVLTVSLIAVLSFPPQTFAAPLTGQTGWLDEMMAVITNLWDSLSGANDRGTSEQRALSAQVEEAEAQQPESAEPTGSTPDEEPPIADIYPGWDPVG